MTRQGVRLAAGGRTRERVRLSVTVAVGVALSVSACGSASSGPPAATTGPLRPVTSQALAADGALECPATISDAKGGAVPALPQGVDGNARLLPDRDPASLVVCRYPVLDITSPTPIPSPYAVQRRTVPDAAARGRIVETLAWAPRGSAEGRICTEMAGNETVFLVGATYSDAVVWVAAKADPNRCAGATNGDFTSRAAVGVLVEGLVSGMPVPVDSGDCRTATMGRLGDDTTLAPSGDPRVTVCRTTTTGDQRATQLTREQSAEVVRELRRLETRRTTGACEGADSDPDRTFRLVLAYAAGPGSVVNVVPGCRAPVLGDGLEADDAGDLVSLVEQWSKPIPGPGPDAPVSNDATGRP